LEPAITNEEEDDMSEFNSPHLPGPTVNGDMFSEGGLRAPPGLGFWRKIWWWFDFIILVKLARLRFIAVLVAIGGVIAYWDTLQAYYAKWTRPATSAAAVADADTEYWCPMHPTIVRDHADKCPICGMPLSKRKKGETHEDEALPPGIVSRVQLTPYRVALAGIQTAEVGYQPLVQEINTVGFVEFDERRLARIAARVTGKSRIDKLYVNVTGQTVTKGEPMALLYSPELVVTTQNLLDARRGGNRDLERMARDRLELWGIEKDQIDDIMRAGKPITQVTIRSPIGGHVIKKYQIEGEYVEEGARLYDVADLSTVWIEGQVYEDELVFLREGLTVSATTKAHPNRTFDGKVAFLHPHLDAATRTLRVRYDMANPGHDLRPGMYASVKLQVPMTRLTVFRHAFTDDWQRGTATDLAVHAVANPSGLAASGGLISLLQAAEQRAVHQQGLVLAIPERSVIDTGSRKIVYREAEPNVYEGVEVRLGPRCGGFYPMVNGLELGDHVATAGSFLIDAETRLTGGVSSTYFGASGGPGGDRRAAARPSMTEDQETLIQSSLAKLSAADRQLAESQRFCPVLTDNRLGVMGVPVKLILQGQTIFLCCKGCIKSARENEAKTLAKVAEMKNRPQSSPPTAVSPGTKEAEIQARLAKLSPEDRRLAEAQGYCPIIPRNRLGAMDVPFKIMVKGQAVFLCCDGCEEKALAHPDKTLATVEQLKAKIKAEKKP
jgi:Cu(I)/Ag(I) efflux system membrane fusion protein